MEASAAGPTITEEPGGAPAASPPDDGPKHPEYTPPVDDREGVRSPDELDDDDEREGPPGPPELDDEELLEPKIAHVEREIGPDEKGRTSKYMQKPLTYFGKIELYGLLGRAVDIAMEGENGIGLDIIEQIGSPKDMMSRFLKSLPGADTAPDAAESDGGIEEAGKMLAAFAKVISMSPDLLKEAYCLALGAPKGHRPWLMEWGLPVIDDEMGIDILHTFIDQNWGVMEDFFIRELPKVMRRAAKARQRHRSASGR